MSNYAAQQAMCKIAMIYYSSITIKDSGLMFLKHFCDVVYKKMLHGRTHRGLVRIGCYIEAFTDLLKDINSILSQKNCP